MKNRELDPAWEINPRGARYVLKEMLLLIPELMQFLGRLLRDERIPIGYKTLLGLVMAYVVIPTDLVPDFITFFGQIDDLLLIALALNGIINECPQGTVEEHWNGDIEVLCFIQNVLTTAVSFVPKKMKQRLYKLAEYKA